MTQLMDVIAAAVRSEAEQQHERLSDSIVAHQRTWAIFEQKWLHIAKEGAEREQHRPSSASFKGSHSFIFHIF